MISFRDFLESSDQKLHDYIDQAGADVDSRFWHTAAKERRSKSIRSAVKILNARRKKKIKPATVH